MFDVVVVVAAAASEGAGEHNSDDPEHAEKNTDTATYSYYQYDIYNAHNNTTHLEQMRQRGPPRVRVRPERGEGDGRKICCASFRVQVEFP